MYFRLDTIKRFTRFPTRLLEFLDTKKMSTWEARVKITVTDSHR